MEMATLIYAAWGAATVFVVWHWAATSFLRWRAKRKAEAQPWPEPTEGELLEAQSAGLLSALETVRQYESRNQS